MSSFFVAFSMKKRTAHATAEQRWVKSSVRLQQEAVAGERQQALLSEGDSSEEEEEEEEGELWEAEPAALVGSKERRNGPGISSIGTGSAGSPHLRQIASDGSLLGGSPGTPILADTGVVPAPPAPPAPREP
jgi:hypothetical protein